ncbi:unnamed protein product [Rhizophagus irregularis]|nr:unnamed protein product [Rhizophagus irregularis]
MATGVTNYILPILNIDDYHNIHRRAKPSLLETHNIFHFVTILLNSNSNISRIPYCSNNILIHNPKEIDPELIIEKFENYFMNQIEYQELRSLNNSKLVDFILHPLHSIKDYIESSNILFKVFESSIRNQTVESNSALQIIQKTKIIDAERNNNSFKKSFINSRNPIISQDKLNYLGKKVSLFLFSLFNKIYHNTGNTKQINNSKYPSFILPSFEVNVDVKVLLLAWNTEHKPADDKFCDAENCLLLNNIDSSNARLTTPLKDNEIPLVEEETNDSSGESNDENIQSILERLEQNIDNQFEILYQQWSDYTHLPKVSRYL